MEKLTADRVVGPGTRRAIEAFQRDKGLTVTGKLDGPTLKQLIQSLKVAARCDATPHVEMSMR
jgi:peptidoglycan hydrolase-like protein with peptidoglycan-binding domain